MDFFYLFVAFVILFVLLYFSDIIEFYKQIQFTNTVPGPAIKELTANAKRERKRILLIESTTRNLTLQAFYLGSMNFDSDTGRSSRSGLERT